MDYSNKEQDNSSQNGASWVAETIDMMKHRVGEATSQMREHVPSTDRMLSAVADNSLALVGGAFAVGLLTGLVVPVSSAERSRIGPLRDSLVDRAGRCGRGRCGARQAGYRRDRNRGREFGSRTRPRGPVGRATPSSRESFDQPLIDRAGRFDERLAIGVLSFRLSRIRNSAILPVDRECHDLDLRRRDGIDERSHARL